MELFSYQEQIAKCKDTTDDYGNVWRNETWTIKDYEEFFEDIDRGYLVQADRRYVGEYFVINEDWEEEEDTCWDNNKCERDEFGCCIVCCECKECIKRLQEAEEELAWCEVGEHHVSKDDMWKDFADCQNCVSEKEYKQQMEDGEEEDDK